MAIRKTRSANRRVVRASTNARPIRRRRVMADEDILVDDQTLMDDPIEDEVVDGEILFEVEDVAELLEEVTETPVDAETTDDGEVIFTVGEDEYTVTPDGDEEILESRRIARGRRAVRASTNRRVRGARRRR